MAQQPWRDKSTLYELYHGERMDTVEMGEELGCSCTTITNWFDRLGVPWARAYERKAYLEYLYYKKRMTQQEIADLLNAPKGTVSNHFIEHDIDPIRQADRNTLPIYFSQDGYLTCRHRDCGTRKAFRIHRLQAVAEYGFDAVRDKQVHHKNGMRCDNRAENLEPLSHADHLKTHHEQGDIRPPQLRD